VLIANLDPGLCRDIDIYCERTSAGLNAEPVNALTNLAFFLAAWGAWRIRGFAATNMVGFIGVLIGFVALTGLGSLVFHTVATRWAEWADVIPIFGFMLLYIWFVLTWLVRLSLWTRMLIMTCFAVLTLSLEAGLSSAVLWGGALYLPTLMGAMAIVGALYRMHHPAANAMAAAMATFLLAFTMRSLDMPLCAAMPIGTHFLWHILNATFLYLLVRLAILHGGDHADCHVQPQRHSSR
jgi:hypothetical protein